MDATKKALIGTASGVGGTIFLSGLRQVLKSAGLVYETAPMQVVDRLEETLSLEGRPLAKRATELVAHLGYGAGTGTILGLLRREQEGLGTELAVGTALGVLLWGMGWAGWLPILGADRAPWSYRTPRVLLPILDHAVFGAVWALVYWSLVRMADEGES